MEVRDVSYIEKNFNDITYFEFGYGPKLYVLLSGWETPFSLGDMYNLSLKLSLNSRVIVIDRRGYGLQHNNISERTFENVCFEVASVVEHELEGERGTIVGYSLGGAYAIFLAEKYPHLVENIVSLDMLPYTGNWANLVYSLNYFPSFIFLLLRKIKIFYLIIDSTLEKILRLESTPSEISSEGLRRTRKNLYNNKVMNELKYMKIFIKDIKKRKKCL